MKWALVSIVTPLLLAGCLASAPEAPINWTIDRRHSACPPEGVARILDDVRIARVDVRSPYAGSRLAVLRPDGTIAFDAFNILAAAPSALLRGTTQDAVSCYGLFRRVLSSATSAKTRYALEFDVNTLALDCRLEGVRQARVELTATLLDGRDIVGVASGESAVNADGDFSVAFSSAYFSAVGNALSKLPVK